jgi:hypothetical protein
VILIAAECNSRLQTAFSRFAPDPVSGLSFGWCRDRGFQTAMIHVTLDGFQTAMIPDSHDPRET